MMISRFKLEALTEAIARYSGYNNPDSDTYLARNPGGLKAHSPSQLRDKDNVRVFVSMMDGWQALLFDLALKLRGDSKAKLQKTDTLVTLAESYEQPATAAAAWAGYLRKALRDPSVTPKTTIACFYEE